ncbi:hypothetical protein [Streptomyces buecherae]|uniref:hypothetical protein n=1 Tax=Streptomyces buecherae TaxID=2763006 RepID=UPI0037AF8456
MLRNGHGGSVASDWRPAPAPQPSGELVPPIQMEAPSEQRVLLTPGEACAAVALLRRLAAGGDEAAAELAGWLARRLPASSPGS